MRSLEQLQEQMKSVLAEQALILAEYEAMEQYLTENNYITNNEGRLYWTHNNHPLAGVSLLKLQD